MVQRNVFSDAPRAGQLGSKINKKRFTSQCSREKMSERIGNSPIEVGGLPVQDDTTVNPPKGFRHECSP
jgi:hypothetical protein